MNITFLNIQRDNSSVVIAGSQLIHKIIYKILMASEGQVVLLRPDKKRKIEKCFWNFKCLGPE